MKLRIQQWKLLKKSLAIFKISQQKTTEQILGNLVGGWDMGQTIPFCNGCGQRSVSRIFVYLFLLHCEITLQFFHFHCFLRV